MRPFLMLALLSLSLALATAPAAAGNKVDAQLIFSHTNPLCDVTDTFCEGDCVLLGVIGSPGSTVKDCFPGLPWYPPLP